MKSKCTNLRPHSVLALGIAASFASAAMANIDEGFEDITTLAPAGWHLQNNSSPLGTTGWFQGSPTAFPAHEGPENSYIGANFNNTAGGTGIISNWLLTPPINMQNGDELVFWTRAGGTWADRLEVRLSTAGGTTDVGTTATSVGAFDTLLLSINPDLTVDGYPEEWTQYTVTISGLSEATLGRIGFRYFVTDAGPTGANSNYIGIDTLTFSGGAPSNCPGDLNGDNVVNVSDLLILLGAWGPCPGCDADLNGDDVVNVSDLLILLGAWGACPAPPDPTGACCFDDGSCIPDLSASGCDEVDGNFAGNFSACGSCPQPPNGETCDLALPINIGDTATANTTGNPVGNAPGCGDAVAPNSPTAWYSVVGNGTTLTADTCASSIATGTNVAVYCANCDAPICVAGSTENFDCFDNPFNGSATWCAGDGEVYYIAVWGEGAAGDVSLALTSNGSTCTPSVTCSVANDECEDAIDITANIDGPPVEGSNADANSTGHPAGSPSCQWQNIPTNVTNTVWYSFTANGIDNYTIETCSSIDPFTDSVLTLYSGECGSLTEIGCGGDDCPAPDAPPYYSRIITDVLPAGTYLIAVSNNGGWGGSTPGDFVLTIETGGEPPAPCDVVSCTDTEGEPCGDNVNNGCSTDPASAFDNIALGGSVCGNLWADDGTRDLDWYLFEITEPTEVTVTMNADEISRAWIASATDFSICAGVDIITTEAGCEVTITACLNPGTYAMIIGASVFDGFPCPGYQYTATITGTPVTDCN